MRRNDLASLATQPAAWPRLVRERLADIRDSDVAAALACQRALTVREVSYLPVGFGGYHWLAVDARS